MFERYVFLKLYDPFATPEGRDDLVQLALTHLPAIPGVLSVRAGAAAPDGSDAAWDVSFAIRFRSLEDIPPYLAHPDHQRFVDAHLTPRVAFRKAWNFQIEESA